MSDPHNAEHILAGLAIGRAIASTFLLLPSFNDQAKEKSLSGTVYCWLVHGGQSQVQPSSSLPSHPVLVRCSGTPMLP